MNEVEKVEEARLSRALNKAKSSRASTQIPNWKIREEEKKRQDQERIEREKQQKTERDKYNMEEIQKRRMSLPPSSGHQLKEEVTKEREGQKPIPESPRRSQSPNVSSTSPAKSPYTEDAHKLLKNVSASSLKAKFEAQNQSEMEKYQKEREDEVRRKEEQRLERAFGRGGRAMSMYGKVPSSEPSPTTPSRVDHQQKDSEEISEEISEKIPEEEILEEKPKEKPKEIMEKKPEEKLEKKTELPKPIFQNKPSETSKNVPQSKSDAPLKHISPDILMSPRSQRDSDKRTKVMKELDDILGSFNEPVMEVKKESPIEKPKKEEVALLRSDSSKDFDEIFSVLHDTMKENSGIIQEQEKFIKDRKKKSQESEQKTEKKLESRPKEPIQTKIEPIQKAPEKIPEKIKTEEIKKEQIKNIPVVQTQPKRTDLFSTPQKTSKPLEQVSSSDVDDIVAMLNPPSSQNKRFMNRAATMKLPTTTSDLGKVEVSPNQFEEMIQSLSGNKKPTNRPPLTDDTFEQTPPPPKEPAFESMRELPKDQTSSQQLFPTSMETQRKAPVLILEREEFFVAVVSRGRKVVTQLKIRHVPLFDSVTFLNSVNELVDLLITNSPRHLTQKDGALLTNYARSLSADARQFAVLVNYKTTLPAFEENSAGIRSDMAHILTLLHNAKKSILSVSQQPPNLKIVIRETISLVGQIRDLLKVDIFDSERFTGLLHTLIQKVRAGANLVEDPVKKAEVVSSMKDLLSKGIQLNSEQGAPTYRTQVLISMLKLCAALK